MTPEGKIKAKVKKLLAAYGRSVFWYMPSANGFGKSGIPDFMGCANGWAFAIETKADETKEPTALQRVRMQEIRDAGGKVFVVRSDAELDMFKTELNWMLTH